jgi:hypothetical protein
MPEESLIAPAGHKRTLIPTGHRFLLLFVFLLGLLVAYPFIHDSGVGYFVFRILGVCITLLGVYAISFRRGLLFFAIILAVPAILQHLMLSRKDAGIYTILIVVSSFCFDVFVVVVIFRRVFANERPNGETISGALCIYLLVGFGFANIYDMLYTLQPRAFYLDPASNLHSIPERFDFLYYSFGTMTSLGAAGITPVTGQARSLTVIEAILGILYLAVLISRLMGAYRSHYDS